VPTYDYECDACGKTFEVRQRISAEPLTACQFCGGRVRRLLSPAAFILKGGGWYVTDYPSESRKKAIEAEKKAGGTTDATKPDGAGAKADGGAAKPDGGAAKPDGGAAKPDGGAAKPDGGAAKPDGGSAPSSTPSTASGSSARS
jgi:putative FmdB family regulatory protein